MEIGAFLIVIATGIAVMVISLLLDHLWAQVLPVRFLYYLLRCPGVVVHECSHILGCILTGASIKKVVFFSQDGGSVTYTKPKIPVIGDVIISTAPLFVIPLVLFALTWCFARFLDCTFPLFPSSIVSIDSAYSLLLAIAGLFPANLIPAFHPAFLLWLYLTLSLVLSVAPSMPDLRNAILGIAAIAVIGIVILSSGIDWAEKFLWQVVSIIGQGFTLGLVFGLVALAVSLLPLSWYLWTHRPRA